MKRTLFLASILASILCPTEAATEVTYTNFASAWTDADNGVVYNGNGYFAVQSVANTELQLTIDLNALAEYVSKNGAAGDSYLMLWDNSVTLYGIGYNATGSGETVQPTITAFWGNEKWANTTADTGNFINFDYSTLSASATNNTVTISLTNSQNKIGGVTATLLNSDADQGTAKGLKSSSIKSTSGYYINTDFVTSVTLKTESTLNTDTFDNPITPFESQREDGTSIGRVTFMGDSITHGVNDQSYRWQLFKTLTDNGIENEIVGPRTGYASNAATDTGTSYGGEEFNNVHLANASGRTYNIITGITKPILDGVTVSSNASVNYGGNSTATTALKYNSDSWFCMMGTNDLLSDTPTNGTATEAQFASKMQHMLGGTVQYNDETKHYEWTQGETWGTIGTMVGDVYGEGDTFYMLSIIPWANHDGGSNHGAAKDYYAVQEYNRLLQDWITAYTKTTEQKVEYVDVTRGMVDYTSGTSFKDASGTEYHFKSHDDFFNDVQTRDRLHPNAQGSLLMAGNLARHLGIGGRTAGLERQGTSGWKGATIGTVTDGASLLVAENAFTMTDGYTIDFAASFGNGAADGWMTADNALSISLGDGTNSGTLNLSEGYIMWGADVLFCWDNSTLADEGNLRIAWHNGNAADNVLSGYYVWLDDMLIGQGLNATTGTGLNGILISSNGGDGTITGLTWADQAYAPTTTGKVSAENAYYTTQDAASTSGFVSNTASLISSGKDYTGVDPVAYTDNAKTIISTATQAAAAKTTVVVSGAKNLLALSNQADTKEVNVRLQGSVSGFVYGTLKGASGGALTLEVEDGTTINGGNAGANYAAIAGSYDGGSAESFHVYLNGGTIGTGTTTDMAAGKGDVVGGASGGTGTIKDVKIVVNGSTVHGNILGGSKTGGTVDKASIIVANGTVNGSIIAGGNAGTIGDTSVTITGGTITGDITKGNAQYKNGASASVTVEGNSARIGGNITADKVTLRGVSASDSTDGFDKYAGTITTDTLTLDNVQVDLKVTLDAGVTTVKVYNESSTSMVMGDSFTLTKMLLSDGSSFTAYKVTDASGITSAQETTLSVGTLEVGMGVTLNANLVFNADSMLILNDTLCMGSDVALSSGMGLTLSEAMLAQLYGCQTVVLFEGVDALSLDGESLTAGDQLNVNGVFSNLDLAYDYTLAYTEGMVTITAIPEPATTTLSLLALAGLAARRRRKA